MSNELVILQAYLSGFEANLARSQLAFAGIESVVLDELAVGTLLHMGPALGGVKLQVRQEDAEEALAVLREAFAPEESDVEGPAPLPTPAQQEEFAREEAWEAELPPQTLLMDRATRAAVYGLLLFPVQWWSLYLMGKRLAMPQKLTAQERGRMILLTIVNLPGLATGVFLACLLWETLRGL
jgi:hypothetical protein